LIEEAICHLFLSFVLSFSREISFRIYLFSIPSFSLCRLFFLNQGLKHMFQFSTSTTTTMLLPRVPSDRSTYCIEIIVRLIVAQVGFLSGNCRVALTMHARWKRVPPQNLPLQVIRMQRTDQTYMLQVTRSLIEIDDEAETQAGKECCPGPGPYCNPSSVHAKVCRYRRMCVVVSAAFVRWIFICRPTRYCIDRLDHPLLSSGGGIQHLRYPTDMMIPVRYSIQQNLACSDGLHREAWA
jgi:hypothetical protein